MRPIVPSFGIAALLFALAGHRAGAQQTPPATAGLSALEGYVLDSVHVGALAGATVSIEGTSRSTTTDAEGRYRIDSIPPGPHSVIVLHPLLDTLGLKMHTPAYPFAADKVHQLDLVVPAGERVAMALCTPMQRTRGPAAMLGFVRDPDTGTPAPGAKVQLVYQTSDSSGRTVPTLREARSDTAGYYKICGIPADMQGKVQVFRNGVSSGEVPVEVTHGLALRAFTVSQHQVVAEVRVDSGKVVRVARGSARVTGKVVDKLGRPLAGARVMLQGQGGETVLTRADGEFTLDSLPPGTQALLVRKLGYSVTDAAVELASNQATETTVTMEDFVPTLETMRVEAAADRALVDVGYVGRKRGSQGYFMDGSAIDRKSATFSDVMRAAPGLRIIPTGDGRTSMILDGRAAGGGCVNFYVDGMQWTTMTPGDIDDFVKPSELVAVEVYHGMQTPPQFTPAGRSGCATVVAWTVARIRQKSGRQP